MKTPADAGKEKELLESIIKNSAVATFALGAHHKVIYWNDACEELTGIKAKEVVGTDGHWKAFYRHRRPCVADIVLYGLSEDFSNLYKTRSKSLLSKGGLHAEDWFRNLGGKDRYVIFDAAPIHDEEGNIIAAVETLQDITALKRSEEALEEHCRSVTAAFNSLPAPAAIISVDEKKYVEVNRSWEMLTGYSREALVGRKVLGSPMWPDPLEPERLIEKAVESRGFRDAGILIKPKAGETMTWLLSADLLEYSGRLCVIFSGQKMAGGKK
jgi:two-component system, NtrC family, sensor kinase